MLTLVFSSETVQNYVTIKTQGQSRLAFRELPLLIGSSAEADIIINSPSMADIAKVIFGENGALQVKDVGNGHMQPVESLRKAGVYLIGPIGGDVAKASSPLGLMRLLAAYERQIFGSFPKKMQTYLGGSLAQWQRLATWFGVLVILGAVYGVLGGQPQEIPDLSDRPIALEVGRIQQRAFGMKGTPSAYRSGVSFRFAVPESARDQALLVSYQYIGIDVADELQVTLNGEVIAAHRAEPGCLERFCETQIKVPLARVLQTDNRLRFVHEQAGGDYAIRNVLVAPLTRIKDEEMIVLERTARLAERYYDDREVVVDNLINARKEVERALAIINRTEGADAMAPALNVLRNNIDTAYDQRVEELFFGLKKNLKLGNFNAAEGDLQKLLVLHPDSTTEKHQFLKNQLVAIRRMMK